MIFYFTATGNSLYAAKKIGEELKEELFSIPQEVKKSGQTYQAESIGIVAPIYAGELPKIVRRFLENAHFETSYFYMVLTYGNLDSVAGEWSEAFAKKLGIQVDYITTIKMVDNYLPVFDMEEQKAIDKHVEEQLAEAILHLKDRRKGIPVPTEEGRSAYNRVSQRDKEHPEFNNGEQITVTDACIGCGLCAKVCPIGNFVIQDGKAVKQSPTCEFCLACANHCPQKAIGLSLADRNPNSRYRHESISVAEIIQANQQ